MFASGGSLASARKGANVSSVAAVARSGIRDFQGMVMKGPAANKPQVQVRGGEKKNRHADSSDKQLHHSLFGRQVWMSCGLLAWQKIEYSRDREENGQRENTVDFEQREMESADCFFLSS
eukprot:superscaffoldBa00000215_g2807